MFEDDDFIHNTTGNQDRKRRKTCLKTLVLSGNKNYENEAATCPKIGQFCPEHHEQESIHMMPPMGPPAERSYHQVSYQQ